MKYLGLWLVVAAGIGLGRYYSRRLYRRAERLQQLVRLLETLQQQLTYTALPLSALWRRLAAGEAFRAAAADADLGVRLHGAVAEHAVRREKNVK